MAGNTAVYRVVYADQDGNHNALVFKEPTEGKAYADGEMVAFGSGGTSFFAAANDEGAIPHREPGDGELGITWHFAK